MPIDVVVRHIPVQAAANTVRHLADGPNVRSGEQEFAIFDGEPLAARDFVADRVEFIGRKAAAIGS